MTAVASLASPPTFQPGPRLGWNSGDSAQGLTSMSAEDVSRIFMPRKVPERSNSSSSLSSVSSLSSTASTSTNSSNNSQITTASRKGEANTQAERENWVQRKKPARGLWPAVKSEPVSGISNARPQSLPLPSSGASAASAMAVTRDSSTQMAQNLAHMQQMTDTANASRRVGMLQGGPEPTAVLVLLPMNGTFERKQITVPLFPDVLRIGRQTNAKTVPTPTNGFFDSKVLSRQHAEVWADRNGKIWIRDVKSSNGTFVNGVRLSPENRDSEPHEVRELDMLELGIDIVSEDQKSIVHHKVSAKVEHAGIHHNNSTNILDMNFSDIDPGSGGGLMGPPFPPHIAQMRGRNGSQGSVASNGRLGGPVNMNGGNMSGFGAQRQMNAWLNPITIEQVVKKLSAEIKLARQQSHDLQRTSEFFNAILSQEPGQEPPKAPADLLPPAQISEPLVNGLSPSNKLDPLSPFLQPPAPPPQQPLPEKPDAARPATADSGLQTSPRRTENDRPRSPMNTSPAKPDVSASQILSLVEALSSTKRELASQGDRVKHLEDLLMQERRARESAEERARKLFDLSIALGGNEADNRLLHERAPAPESVTDSEDPDTDMSDFSDAETINGDKHLWSEPATTSPVAHTTGTAEPIESDTDNPVLRLEARIDLLMREIEQSRIEIEKCRQRAEVAEETRDSLAQMVERIRASDSSATSISNNAERRKSAEISTQTDTPTSMNGHIDSFEDTHIGDDTGLERIANGSAVPSLKDVQETHNAIVSALANQGFRNERFLQAGPYASMLGVVLIGVGIMTYLNGGWKADQ